MGKYRTIGNDLNRKYNGDLNHNFSQIEIDITSAKGNTTQLGEQLTAEINRVEQESIQRDNLISGADVPAILESIENATNAANSAASSAMAKGNTAEQQGNTSETKGNTAEQQGDYAELKGNYADEKAQLADSAAANASNEAANLGALKVAVTEATQTANTAAGNANTQATEAQNQAAYAKEQGDYAKEQGDNIANLNFISNDEKGVPGGVATLGTNGKLFPEQVDVPTINDASLTQKGIVQLSEDTNSQSETLVPNMKALYAVKSIANDIKTKWATVVGVPLSPTDTQQVLNDKTQTIKNTFATYLTSKGVSSSGTETLEGLVNKIPSISTAPKVLASGTATTSSDGRMDASFGQNHNDMNRLVIYFDNTNNFPRVIWRLATSSQYYRMGELKIFTNEGGYANSGGFRIFTGVNNTPLYWEVIK